MTECPEWGVLKESAEVCPADSDFPELPVDSFDLCVSLLGLALAAAMLLRIPTTSVRSWSLDQCYRIFCEHFRFLLIVQLAYDHRLQGAQRVLFDLVFPLYNLSLAVYRHTTYELLRVVGVPGSFVSGCTAISAWNLLVFLAAAACVLLSRDAGKRYSRVMTFNFLAAPDFQLVVSMGFASYGRTSSFPKSALCFATSLQWTLFSVIMPTILEEGRSRLGARLFESDFRESMRLWQFAVKAMQVGLIAALHITKIYFASLPGYALCLLLLLVFTFRQLQTMYWPYQSRLMNFVADDTYLSLMLMCLWGRFRSDLLATASYCLPLRQAWRLLKCLPRPGSQSQPLRSPPEEVTRPSVPKGKRPGRYRRRTAKLA